MTATLWACQSTLVQASPARSWDQWPCAISRRGDTHLRGLLYEAATVILTRTSAESSLRTWGLKLKERIGFKRAAVAVARKLAVVMHAMLRSGQLFDRTAGVAA